MRTIQNGTLPATGYTTGSCAAAAARAAAGCLLGNEFMRVVLLKTPHGKILDIKIRDCQELGNAVRCVVRKDAGDDPDVTDGALIGCTVMPINHGIEIEGGEGVGRVTKPGLACSVGEAAINPVPRGMIEEQLRIAANLHGYDGGLRAVVDVPEGRRLAAKTFNPRLGIEGGISILGTTGIVEPMSMAALKAAIQAEINVLAASGLRGLLMVPGNYGGEFARRQFGISPENGVKCSNLIGETLDYAVWKGFRRILILGHAGKLVKLAAGIMNTWSRVADGRMEILAAHAGLAGLDRDKIAALMDCVTVDAADQLLTAWGAADAVWKTAGERALFHLQRRAGEETEIAFAAFTGRGIVMEQGDVNGMKEAFQ